MSPETDYKLTIAKIPKINELPLADASIAAGRTLIGTVTRWKRGKAFSHGVQTYSKAKSAGDGAGWHSRVSTHTPEDATFDEFWKYLGEEHAAYEKEYIKEVKKATLLKELGPNQNIWSMYYEFPTIGVSPRVFTCLQIAHLENTDGKRTGLFIQIPVDVSDQPELAGKEDKGVKGHYVSVEHFQELDNGKVEWRMATSSSPGGRIPSILVESTMASQIAADVPHFLKWLRTVRPKDGAALHVKDTQAPTASATDATPAEVAAIPEVTQAAMAATAGTVPPTVA